MSGRVAWAVFALLVLCALFGLGLAKNEEARRSRSDLVMLPDESAFCTDGGATVSGSTIMFRDRNTGARMKVVNAVVVFGATQCRVEPWEDES